MACQKSGQDVFLAVLVLTIIIFAFGSTFYGLFRYTFNLTDDQYINRDHLVLAGNILQVVSLGGAMYFLNSVENGPFKLGMIVAMFILLVIILYLSNYDVNDKQVDSVAAGWTGMILLVIDLYVKVTAVFMGFGVCSVDEMPKLLGGMMKTLMSGSKKR
jgi:hypothetical protein